MASYLYAVQDQNGREVVSAHVDVEKVSDVHAELVGDQVVLAFEDLIIEQGDYWPTTGQLTLHRWPSDDKLATPVSHPVK